MIRTWEILDILELLGDQGLKFAQVDAGAFDHIDQDVVCHLKKFVRTMSRIEECPEGSNKRKNIPQRPASKWMDKMQHDVRDWGWLRGWGITELQCLLGTTSLTRG